MRVSGAGPYLFVLEPQEEERVAGDAVAAVQHLPSREGHDMVHPAVTRRITKRSHDSQEGLRLSQHAKQEQRYWNAAANKA
jgi:hypothetical protein